MVDDIIIEELISAINESRDAAGCIYISKLQTDTLVTLLRLTFDTIRELQDTNAKLNIRINREGYSETKEATH